MHSVAVNGAGAKWRHRDFINFSRRTTMLIAYLLTTVAASTTRTLRTVGTVAAIGATLAVVAYAHVAGADAAVRAHIVLQGLGIICLSLLAALLAGAIQHAGVRIERRLAAGSAPVKTRSAAAL
jgi:hypothetical protein